MRLAVFILLFSSCQATLAQQDSTAVLKKANDVKESLQIFQNKADSLLSLKDSIKIKKLDSLKALNPLGNINSKVDSLRSSVTSKVQSVNQKIVSVENGVQNKIDSVQNKLLGGVNNFTEKAESQVEKGTNKVNELQDKLSSQSGETLKVAQELGVPTSDLNRKLPGLNGNIPDIKSEDVTIPGVSITEPKTNLPDADVNSGLPSPELKTDLNLNMEGKLKLPEVKNELAPITDKLGNVKELQNEASQYVDQAKELKENGIRNADTEKLEKEAMKLTGLEDLNTGKGELDAKLKEYTKIKTEQEQLLLKYKDKKLIEAELKRKIKNVVSEEINANVPAVKKVQDQLSQVQKIRPFTKDAKELVTKRVNEMKGKTFQERLVPGLAFQTYLGNVFSMDLSQQVGYRFTGRLTGGIGGLYRVSINKKYNAYVQGSGVYGGRVYLDFKAIRSFYLHGEFETLKLEDRSFPAGLENSQHVVYSSHFGVGKQFNMGKRISAMMLGFYRLEYSGHLPGVSKYNTRLVLNLKSKKKKVNETK